MTSELDFLTYPHQTMEIMKDTVIRPELVEDEPISFEAGDIGSDISIALLEDLNIVLKSATNPIDDAELFNAQLESVVNHAVDEVKFCNILEPQPCVERLKMDLAFMIDSSSSIGSENFEKVKSFVSEIVSRFEIGPDLTRVSK